jgi:hypothetical protein
MTLVLRTFDEVTVDKTKKLNRHVTYGALCDILSKDGTSDTIDRATLSADRSGRAV